MALTVVGVSETLRGLFVVRLAQQGVEAVVQAGTQANISSVASQRAIAVLLWQKLLLVVVSWLVEVVLIQGGQHSFVGVQ